MDLELGFFLDHFFQGYNQPWDSTNQQKPFLKWRGNECNLLLKGRTASACTCVVLLRPCLKLLHRGCSYRWNSAPRVAACVNNSHDAITRWTSGEVSCDLWLRTLSSCESSNGDEDCWKRKLRREGRATNIRYNIQEKRPWRHVIPATMFRFVLFCFVLF